MTAIRASASVLARHSIAKRVLWPRAPPCPVALNTYPLRCSVTHRSLRRLYTGASSQILTGRLQAVRPGSEPLIYSPAGTMVKDHSSFANTNEIRVVHSDYREYPPSTRAFCRAWPNIVSVGCRTVPGSASIGRTSIVTVVPVSAFCRAGRKLQHQDD